MQKFDLFLTDKLKRNFARWLVSRLKMIKLNVIYFEAYFEEFQERINDNKFNFELDRFETESGEVETFEVDYIELEKKLFEEE